MAYDIVKSWPSQGAIDESLVPATETVEFMKSLKGKVINLASTGKVGLATYTGDTKTVGIPFFCIDYGHPRKQVLGIKSPCVIQCDSDHYDSGSYAVGATVTANAGKFKVAGEGDGVVGKVLNFDAVSGKLRVLWTATS